MHLIIGLGNPGKEYADTRHNAGFLCLEYIREAWGFSPFQENTSFQAECSDGRIENEKILLARPLTFMNISGGATQRLAHFYKIDPKNIAVIHDDLDISLGDVRESFGSRSAGHNGVGDIIETLGTKDFLRFRIGIKTPENETEKTPPRDTAAFVLEPFPKDERVLVEKTFPHIAERLQMWIQKN